MASMEMESEYSMEMAVESMEFHGNLRDGGQPFCQIFSKKIKVAYRSEMARNAIESEFRTSKMADVSHFVKNFKKN